jgi:hypothetical protein
MVRVSRRPTFSPLQIPVIWVVVWWRQARVRRVRRGRRGSREHGRAAKRRYGVCGVVPVVRAGSPESVDKV